MNSFVPGGDYYYTEPYHVVMDSTAPEITRHVSGILGSNGWYIGDVTVEFTVTDDESEILTTSGCESVVVDYDTTGVTFTCTATSAGGASTKSVTIKRDATDPIVTGTASPPPNTFGWNNTNVQVSFTGTDETSGVAYCTPSVLLIREAVGLSATGSCTDNAGNTSDRLTVGGINIDKTAPEVTVTDVEHLAVYILGDVPVAGCHTEDNLSGIVVEASLALTGGNPDGTGTFTATCSGALDLAGNTSEDVSATYKVITPQGAATIAIDSVEQLQKLDVLNDGLTESLVTKLEIARKAMDTLSNPRVALNLLNAFINEVESLVEDGVLTPEQGQALIDEIQAIIDAIS